MNPLEALLRSHEYLLADGGVGTMLMDAGVEQGDPPEEWNVLYPERVRALHRGYVAAGAQIILTNSFGGNPFRLQLHNLQDRIHELNVAAAQLARAEAEAGSQTVVVAGSMGPSGEILAPLGSLRFDEARHGFAQQAAALAEGGVDVLWIETMSDLNEVRAAVEGARSVSSVPLVTTMTFDTNGRTMMGVTSEQALESLRQFELLALGGNCGNGPAEIEDVIGAMHAVDPSLVLVAKSNAGIPELVDGEIVYSGTPGVMARYAVRVRDLGARIIGACCGSTPAHIAAMGEALENSAGRPDTESDPYPRQKIESERARKRVRQRRYRRDKEGQR
jgi:5-methyltetrahydrofolate--homocysteine methyltransferase